MSREHGPKFECACSERRSAERAPATCWSSPRASFGLGAAPRCRVGGWDSSWTAGGPVSGLVSASGGLYLSAYGIEELHSRDGPRGGVRVHLGWKRSGVHQRRVVLSWRQRHSVWPNQLLPRRQRHSIGSHQLLPRGWGRAERPEHLTLCSSHRSSMFIG